MKLNELPTDDEIDAAANQRIERRRETGRRLMKIARELRDAQQQVEHLTKQYSDAYREATEDAWTPQELSATGLPAPAQRRRARRKASVTTAQAKKSSSRASEDSGSATPDQRGNER